MHVDTVNTHVVSAIINVDQQLDEEVSYVLLFLHTILHYNIVDAVYRLLHFSFSILSTFLYVLSSASTSSIHSSLFSNLCTSNVLLLTTSIFSSPSLTHLPPLFSSLIIRAQWPLLILDHNDKEHEIKMSPGDMVLYESAKLLHGRPSTFTIWVLSSTIFCLPACLPACPPSFLSSLFCNIHYHSFLWFPIPRYFFSVSDWMSYLTSSTSFLFLTERLIWLPLLLLILFFLTFTFTCTFCHNSGDGWQSLRQHLHPLQAHYRMGLQLDLDTPK